MNRPIKFRVWNNKSKTWKGADYNVDGGDRCAHLCCKLKNGIFTLNSTENLIYQLFTGLLDKNGREIYEGDIVEYTYKSRSDKFTGIFEWFVCGFCINRKVCGDNPIQCDNFEIIGNVFENGELIR